MASLLYTSDAPLNCTNANVLGSVISVAVPGVFFMCTEYTSILNLLLHVTLCVKVFVNWFEDHCLSQKCAYGVF